MSPKLQTFLLALTTCTAVILSLIGCGDSEELNAITCDCNIICADESACEEVILEAGVCVPDDVASVLLDDDVRFVTLDEAEEASTWCDSLGPGSMSMCACYYVSGCTKVNEGDSEIWSDAYCLAYRAR